MSFAVGRNMRTAHIQMPAHLHVPGTHLGPHLLLRQVNENNLLTVNEVINEAALNPALSSLCTFDVVHESHLRGHVLANLRLIVAKHGHLKTYSRMLLEAFLQLSDNMVMVKRKDGQPDMKMRITVLRCAHLWCSTVIIRARS